MKYYPDITQGGIRSISPSSAGRIRDFGPRNYTDPRQIGTPLGSGQYPLTDPTTNALPFLTGGMQSMDGFSFEPGSFDMMDFTQGGYGDVPALPPVPNPQNQFGGQPRLSPGRVVVNIFNQINNPRGMPPIGGGGGGGDQGTVLASWTDRKQEPLFQSLEAQAETVDYFGSTIQLQNAGANEKVLVRVDKPDSPVLAIASFKARQAWSPAANSNLYGLCRIKANPYDPSTTTETDDETTVYLWTPRDDNDRVWSQPFFDDNTVFQAALDDDGDWYAVGHYLDGVIGYSMRLWYDKDNIPAGWQLADGTNSMPDFGEQSLLPYKSGGSLAGTIGGTGGAECHCHAAHTGSHMHNLTTTTVTLDPGSTTAYELLTTTCTNLGSVSESHNLVSHRSPYKAAAVIIRIDNSVAW